MIWFRRKRKPEQEAPETAPAPQEAPQADEQAEAGSQAPSADRRRRRRGTRGGKGRRKSGAAAPEQAAEADEAAAQKPKPSRAKDGKPERRQERKSAERRGKATRRRVAPKRAPLPQAKRELLISVDVGEKRVAVLEDGKVAEVYLERPERRSIAGNIYLGTVDNVLPGMEAAFIEIGLEKNGFLYVDEIVRPELEAGGHKHGKKIQELIQKGQAVLVQAVKDPMKTKGARLTMDISLPGRFVVFVPYGEGLGVSRRLPDEERTRLKDILRKLDVKEGGVIVRTAAEGASAEDVERDLVFLQRLWKTIQDGAKRAKAPCLVYQEAELPLRVVRDLFTGDFERAVVDHEKTHKRIVGYLKKTSPHMVDRVERYKEREPLMEALGVEAEIRSTLSRRVDLPSGGYLIFDYAEAFTVIDVNTGRFVGSRSKTSGARLEDTITKNNLEAVTEVVRQLRLRDIGGIIVIDFIDMANPKNRAAVEEALRTELERDRTKTYVVEISPLGLVEMTRQNVTEGPREILTRKCPTCAGDGVVVSETTVAVDVERRLRALVTPGSRVQAYRVELHPRIASALVGPGGERLAELEASTRRRFFFRDAPDGKPLDHFKVLAEGKLDDLRPDAPVAEEQELEVKLVEVGLHDPASAVAKVDGYDVCVADAAKQVGKKVKVRIGRVLDGVAYAAVVGKAADGRGPITAESEAEKPTRARKSRAAEVEAEAEAPEPPPSEAEVEAGEAETEAEGEAEGAEPKKKTRRGSRGGRRRKRKPVEGEATEAPEAEAQPEPTNARGPRIHVPAEERGDEEAEAAEQAADELPADATADEAPKPRKKTRRGSRGGRKRKKPAGASEEGAEADEPAAGEEETAEAEQPAADAEPAETNGDRSDEDWGYVPMSEWEDWDAERSSR